MIFDDGHQLSLEHADVLTHGTDIAIFANGMMLGTALAAERVLGEHGVSVSVVNVPVIKPLDTATIQSVTAESTAILTAENHSIIGGLGSAVAETVAEAGLGRPLRRIGLRDTFAEGSLNAPYLFDKYGLSTQSLVDEAWSVLGRPGSAPKASKPVVDTGEYSPV
jgi:transketolase